MSMIEGDWETCNFAQNFVQEQIEEEKLVLELIDKLRLDLGENECETSICGLDKDFGNIQGEVTLSRKATADKPA